MKKLVVFILMIFYFSTYSQSKIVDCESLNNGTFEILEKGVKVGVVFRMNNIQIEKYPNKEEVTYVKLVSNGCNFQFNAYYVKEKIDTVSFDVNYSILKKDHYRYIARPKFLKIDYASEGEIKKNSNKISKEYIELFKELSQKKEKSN
jgi:hypothetical protein